MCHDDPFFRQFLRVAGSCHVCIYIHYTYQQHNQGVAAGKRDNPSLVKILVKILATIPMHMHFSYLYVGLEMKLMSELVLFFPVNRH